LARGAVVVCGSHGGRYPALLAAAAGVRAIILNDAGIGRQEAGVCGLSILDRFGVAAATASHSSCRIGDARDMMTRGVISRGNDAAARVGVASGMTCRVAADHLRRAPHRTAAVAVGGEERRIVYEGGHRPLVLINSASLIDAEADCGAVVITGSHGGLVDGNPANALGADAFLAAFNDAGIGIDDAGIGRLPVLDQRGIAAITVCAASARIGEADSTLYEGIVSRANDSALKAGVREGQRVREFVAHIIGL
jgi:hypothetical protein